MPHKGQRKSSAPNKKKTAAKNDGEIAEAWKQNPHMKPQCIFNGSDHSTAGSSINSNTSSSQADDLSDSMYVRYKKSTLRFKEALQALVPSRIFESDRVQVLMDAADYVSDNALPVNEALLHDLKYTIRVRKRVTCEKFDGGDSGHCYFISVLCYCWSVLAPLCPRKKKEETPIASTRSPKEEEKSSFHNRFASLAIGDEDQGEVKDAEEDLPQYSSKPSRPDETNATELTLQEMMSANELTDCKLFLLTMDEYMEFNCLQYSKLKEKCENNIGSKESPSCIVRDLIQIGVASNTAIQRVAALEERFNHDYPHLNTPNRFLAKLIFPEYAQELSKVVHRLSSVSSRFQDKDAVIFIGDALECAFRDTCDPNNKSSHLVGDFCKRWKISDASEINRIFQGIFLCARIEAPVKPELDMNQDLTRFFQEYGITNPSHNWLPYRFIGGKERSIIHTLRLLQHLPNVSTTDGKLCIEQGLFWPTCDNIFNRPIPTMPFEMDDLLMGNIMPILLQMCYEEIRAICELPFKQEFFSLLSHIELFIKYPDRPVTWTFAFVMHSILSSIFENQGSKHLSYIADTASSAFNRYIQQMKWVKERKVTFSTRLSPVYHENLQSNVLLECLPWMHADTNGQMQRALWNPVCAGCILAFTAYAGNIHAGAALIDSIMQFRAWMHIYNALIQTRHISRGEIPLLDFLYDKFENCKTIWEGPFPVRGQFATRWWIIYGLGVEEAQKYTMSPWQFLFSRAYRLKEETPIMPQTFMRSYKRICMREYTDDTDKYYSDEQSQDWERLYNTVDAIEDDEQLLAFNWGSIGYFLNDARAKLMDHCGWMTELDAFIKNMSDEIGTGRRTMRSHNFRVVRSPKVANDMMKYQGFSHILGRFFATLDKQGTDINAENVAAFMKNYFLHLSLSEIQWFDLS